MPIMTRLYQQSGGMPGNMPGGFPGADPSQQQQGPSSSGPKVEEVD